MIVRWNGLILIDCIIAIVLFLFSFLLLFAMMDQMSYLPDDVEEREIFALFFGHIVKAQVK